MSGWNTIRQIRRVEQQADKLGMKFAAYKYDNEFGANVALIPKDNDALPIYSRDAQLFSGTLEGAESWMHGVEWSRNYDRMVIDKKLDVKRERKEQDERNKQLVSILKSEEVKVIQTW